VPASRAGRLRRRRGFARAIRGLARVETHRILRGRRSHRCARGREGRRFFAIFQHADYFVILHHADFLSSFSMQILCVILHHADFFLSFFIMQIFFWDATRFFCPRFLFDVLNFF
jgi:hypothetical protein